jgi:mannose-6-phosphate isomerase class I
MREILFLEPVFKSMIWGGSRLHTEFGYEIPDDQTGECWAISAHPNGDCRIKNGSFRGRSLSWLWDNHRELFGDLPGGVFPLLVKIIDARADLSIQVHPDDVYAGEKEQGALGKTECWYILDCPEDGRLVLGHNAGTREELKEMIADNRWNELIRLKPIHKGDFFQIEPGTVHAIKAGTMLLETQQNSDITYRLYDYDRLDHGKPRPLHIADSIEVIRCPHEDLPVNCKQTGYENCLVEELIRCRYYTVCKLTLNGSQELQQIYNFMNISIINGEGTIDGISVRKGDHFILPYEYGAYRLEGNMVLIESYIAG